MSAGLTGFTGEKFAYGINEKLLLTKLMKASADVSTNYFCPRISRIYTRARRFEKGDLFGRTRLHEFNGCSGRVLWSSATSLRFSAALGNSSKLDCTRLHENSCRFVRFVGKK